MSMRRRSALPKGAYRIDPARPVAEAPTAGPAPSAAKPRRSRRLRSARRRFTLRNRLIVALLGVALLPLAATGIGAVNLARTSLISQGDDALTGRANATADTIDSYLGGLANSLAASSSQVADVVARDPSLGPTTQAAIGSALSSDSAAGAFGAFGRTDYVGVNGHVAVAGGQAGDLGLNLTKDPAVAAALLTVPNSTIPIPTIAGVTYDPAGPSDLRETVEITVPVVVADAGGTPRTVGVLWQLFSFQKIIGWVQADADGHGAGGMLVEGSSGQAPGLVLTQSIDTTHNYTFTSLSTLSASTVRVLESSGRYIPAAKGQQPQPAGIPGLDLATFQASDPNFSAGTFGGTSGSDMRYARVALKQVPWVYVLGAPQATLAAPADQMTYAALILGAVVLLLALGMGLVAARWVSRRLGGAVEQLGATASAFLGISDEQRKTAEEQRHRLTTARAALREMHGTASDVAEAIERGISLAEAGRGGQGSPYALEDPARAQAEHAWWQQWTIAVRDRLTRQVDIARRLGHDAQVTAQAAGRMRQRDAAIAGQAEAIEVTFWRGQAARVGVAGANRLGAADERAAAAARLNEGRLRLALVALVVVFGLIPPLAFAGTTTTVVRSSLTARSGDGLRGQAQSHARALAALLDLQLQVVTALQQDNGLPADLVGPALKGAVSATGQALGTEELELALPSGVVVADSSAKDVGGNDSGIPAFVGAAQGHPTTSPIYYDPVSNHGWYYLAVPIRSQDLTHIVSIAMGRFSLQPVWALVGSGSSSTSCQDSELSTLVVEAADGVVLADSCNQGWVFTNATKATQTQLTTMWRQGRYPSGSTPMIVGLPEVAANALAAGSSSMAAVDPTCAACRHFTGSGGNGRPTTQYWLVPLSTASWDLVEAQEVPATAAVADQLTLVELLLAAGIVVLTTILGLVLGQSVIVPVRRLRERYRQAARRLVAVARRQDEAAQRQEAVLPPIEATAELLQLETEEVAQALFERGASGIPPLPAQASAVGGLGGYGASGGYGPGGYGPGGYGPGGYGAGAYGPGGPASVVQPDPMVPSLDALRRARVLANDWSLRQQRILADLATALNATDELGRASLDGQREATELANVAGDLLAGSR